MDASPAWVDSVIIIFSQDGNPASWSMGMMKLVTLLIVEISCRKKWLNDVNDQPLVVSSPVGGGRMETSIEMRKWACWEQNVSDVRLGKMEVLPPDTQPEDISGVGGKSVSELTTSMGGGKSFSNIQEWKELIYAVL